MGNPKGYNIRYTYDQVKKIVEEAGCKLLETEYVSNGSPMRFLCQCGNESTTQFRDFIRGRRCQKCKGQKSTERLRKKDEELAAFCEQHGCYFVESFMQKSRSRIKYICKCGETAEAYWTNFRRFPNCKKCGSKKKSGSNCYMWNPDRKAIEDAKKFRKRCSNALARCLKATGQDKIARTRQMLGYSPQQLQAHIYNHPDYQPGMDFHIDHIFPVQAFLDHGIHDLRLINCLENLRPLPGEENLSKADKYDTVTFTSWLSSQTLTSVS